MLLVAVHRIKNIYRKNSKKLSTAKPNSAEETKICSRI